MTYAVAQFVIIIILILASFFAEVILSKKSNKAKTLLPT